MSRSAGTRKGGRTTVRRVGIAKLTALVAAGGMFLTACGGPSAPPGTPSGTTSAGPGGATSATGAVLACPKGKLIGEGSSAQATAIQETIVAYGQECKKRAMIEYNASGSGAGINNFNAGLVDFGGTDSYLKPDEAASAKARCHGNDAWNLPMAIGPIAFAYNVAGVSDLVLTPQVIASIFQGRITMWNAAEITSLNSGTTLPDAKIAIFYRSGESGTTENASKFLKATAPDVWRPNASKAWKGVGGQGKSLSADVASSVKRTKNALSYVEWGAAIDNRLDVARLDMGSGAVELTSASVGKAVEASRTVGTGNDLKMDVDYTTTATGAYPAILVTYEVVCSAGLPTDKTALVKDFLGYYASLATQQSLESLGYAPLPSSVQQKVAAAVSAMT